MSWQEISASFASFRVGDVTNAVKQLGAGLKGLNIPYYIIKLFLHMPVC
jgi:hypothetical protein